MSTPKLLVGLHTTNPTVCKGIEAFLGSQEDLVKRLPASGIVCFDRKDYGSVEGIASILYDALAHADDARVGSNALVGVAASLGWASLRVPGTTTAARFWLPCIAATSADGPLSISTPNVFEGDERMMEALWRAIGVSLFDLDVPDPGPDEDLVRFGSGLTTFWSSLRFDAPPTTTFILH